MGLHHGMTLQRGSVGHVELDRSAIERAGEIADRAVGRRGIVLVWNAGLLEVVAKRVFSLGPLVFHVHKVSGRSRLLKTFSNHERYRLAVACHFRSRQHRMGLAVLAGALLRRVTMGED